MVITTEAEFDAVVARIRAIWRTGGVEPGTLEDDEFVRLVEAIDAYAPDREISLWSTPDESTLFRREQETP